MVFIVPLFHCQITGHLPNRRYQLFEEVPWRVVVSKDESDPDLPLGLTVLAEKPYRYEASLKEKWG